jgi:hypothetical protein
LVQNKVLTITTRGNSLVFSIDLSKQKHPLTSDGDLAFSEYGLLYLMKEVIRASYVDSYFDVADISTVNTAFDPTESGAESKPFVLAMINGYTEWQQASSNTRMRTFEVEPVQEPGLKGKLAPRYMHIIGVTGKIREAGAYYEVPVWTWAAEFTVKIKKEFLPQYIYGYVYGRL